MPDVSKHEAILDGLKNGTYHPLGLIIGGTKITAGEKIAKKGKKKIAIKSTARMEDAVISIVDTSTATNNTPWP